MKNVFKSIVLVVLCLFIGLLGSTKVKADLVRRPPGNPDIWEKEAVDLQWEALQEGEISAEKPYAIYKFERKDYLEFGLYITAKQFMDITVYSQNGLMVAKRSSYELPKEGEKLEGALIDWDCVWPQLLGEVYKGKYYVVISPSDYEKGEKYGKFILSASKRGEGAYRLRLSKDEMTYTGRNIRVKGKVYYVPYGSKKGKYRCEVKGCKKVTYSNLGKDTRKEQKNIKNIGRYKIRVADIPGAYSSNLEFVDAIVTITPPKGAISSVKSKSKNKLEIQTKMIPQVTGCEVQIATNSRFTKNVKTYKMKAKKTITRLNSAQKYYVRVRFYKECNNYLYNRMQQKETIYGPWGKTTAVRCK